MPLNIATDSSMCPSASITTIGPGSFLSQTMMVLTYFPLVNVPADEIELDRVGFRSLQVRAMGCNLKAMQERNHEDIVAHDFQQLHDEAIPLGAVQRHGEY